MKRTILTRFGLATTAIISSLGLVTLPVNALSSTAGAGTSNTAANQATLQRIQTRGDSEINRRLTSLKSLGSVISSSTKLSTDDAATLTTEVSNEISGLQTLETSLNADTTVAAARTDAQSIISEYRVYALILPKVYLVQTADREQTAIAKWVATAAKLQIRLNTEQSAGKNVASLVTALNDMNSKLTTAQATASNIETSVIALQPTDYDSNHSVLSGDRDQLKTGQNQIEGAASDAKTIFNGLTNL
jgi:prophage antirepressor-like protein